ncbi:helix-turn-helix domain-containing protein [Ornithinimicrobium sp. LYQ103]|uniref:helix-turn-helix domain-containing protein n=1 Tax=Ornithinimicrobium sp. LYQ103 TaxID=3378796 RepID=UPI0038537C82
MSVHAIERARTSAGLSQRSLAERAGLSQATLSRIIAGERMAKLPELVALARVTGWSVAALTGGSTVGDRAECAARVTNGSTGEDLHSSLIHFLELDAYLEDQAIR